MTTSTTAADRTAAWTAWHAAHEAARADEHGFLAITSIRWLGAEPERFDDAPGTWSTSADGPVVVLDDGQSIVVDGVEVTGTHRFGPLPERSGTNVVWQDGDETVVIEVARRGGSDVVRPRHPGNPTRTGYTGTPAYEPTPDFVVEAHFEPFDEPRSVTVGSVVDGLQHVYEAPGVLTFDLDGPRSLLAFNGYGGGLLVLFRDRTSGVTTYAANRSLDVPAPDADGRTTIDFNRATNLPCAYTPHATCPLPPAENHLDVAVEAGERLPA
ncbi:uncharacterized protein (DUF1684 family) [Curtobacterium luteum]|uniref:Uncharacterized protein (DUF1684 family) n=1 Tax=Curtobacterium luteum TaxID=33881 RepID=A0A8H9G740_9MICO|nr:DUF1684 domain-containing protein [Curtobacterium luteum]MBM7801360.1 uncharacterized protein (DUF1684 family) [Curtobacterium luteum]NUU49857.1 DUF1684 domain-containing protein [Curtobacterium luteum]GGK91060.1 hypothetical protein GCM10009769_06460 [Curtobacterium luteum]